MLQTVLLTATIICSINQLPAPNRALLSCSGTSLALEVDGVRVPPSRPTDSALLERSFEELAQRWKGCPVAIAIAPGRTRLLSGDGRDLAIEVLRAGFGWASLDHADLRAAEREGRLHQRGIWSADLWQAQRSARTRPVEIPTPGPPVAPARLGPAARLPTVDDPAIWNQRLDDFRRDIEAMTSEPAQD